MQRRDMTRLIHPAWVGLLVTVLAAAQDSQPASPSWEIMRKYDKDGDGKVSLEEYPRGEALFRRLDRDGDGYLTEREFAGPRRGGADADAPRPRREKKMAEPEAKAPAMGEATADASREGLKLFESKIRPVLVANCYQCHASDASNLRA